MLRRIIQVENATQVTRGQVRPWLSARAAAVTAAALLFPLVALVACTRSGDDGGPQLPVTVVISVRPQWAVATATYVRVLAEPSLSAPVVGHLRLGDVARIKSISPSVYETEGTRVRWYEVAIDGLSGWAGGDSFEFFESESRARNAARLLGGPAGEEPGADSARGDG